MTPEKNDRRYKRSRYREENGIIEKRCVSCGGWWSEEDHYSTVNRLGATSQTCMMCVSRFEKNDAYKNRQRR